MGDTQSYERTSSGNASGGHRYETKMTALVALRLYNNFEEFHLASNLKSAGKFDDLVFTVKNGGEHPTWFVQLKHPKENGRNSKITTDMLTSNDTLFSLPDHYQSWKSLAMTFLQPNTTDSIFFKDFAHANFIIFTNAELNKTLKDSSAIKPNTTDIELLSTAGANEKNVQLTPECGPGSTFCQADKNDFFRQLFLTKFCLCTGQRNENELDSLIDTEIQKSKPDILFSPLDLTSLRSQFYDFLNEMDKNPYYLTKQHVSGVLIKFLIAKLTDDVSKKVLVTFNNEFLSKQQYLVESNSSVSIVNYKEHDPFLCMAALEQLNEKKNLFKVQITANKLQNSNVQSMLLNFSKEPMILTIDCVDALPSIGDIIRKLLSSNEKTSIFLLIPTTNVTLTYTMSTEFPGTKLIQFNCTTKDFSPDTSAILNEKKLFFQGHENKNFDISIAAFLLLENSKIFHVGTEIQEENTAIIPQYVKRNVSLNTTLFDCLQHGVVVLYNIDIERAKKVLNKSVRPIEAAFNNIGRPRKTQIQFFVADKKNDDIVNKLIEKFTIVHQITYFQFSWYFKKSTHPGLLKKFFKPTVTTTVFKFLTENPAEFKIISGEKGMGKTCSVFNVAAELVKKKKEVWIILVSLEKYVNRLSNNEVTINLIKEIILEAAGIDKTSTELEKYIFENYLNGGKMYVILDGYDALSPNHLEKGSQLLGVLQQSPIKEVWITTRPNMVDILEELTKSLAYSIEPFSLDNQMNYFQKKYPQMFDKKDQLSSLSQFFGSLDSNIQDFIRIPLHTKIIGEVLETDFKAGDQPNRINLYRLINGYLNNVIESNFPAKDSKYLENLENLAVLATLGQLPSLLTKLKPEIGTKIKNDLRVYVDTKKEKCGLVTEFHLGVPKFTHRIFSDCLLATFLAANPLNSDGIISSELFYSGSFKNVKRMFNEILIEGDPLLEAVLTKNLSIIKTFKKLDRLDRFQRSALHIAASEPNSKHIIEYLLQQNCNLLQKDKLRYTPLQYACFSSVHENIATLVKVTEPNALFEQLTKIDWTFLKLSFECDNLQLFLHLLNQNIGSQTGVFKLNMKPWFGGNYLKGLTFLHLGGYYNSKNILKYLLHNDSRDTKLACLNFRDTVGNTALQYAITRLNIEAIDILLNAGAEFLKYTPNGKSPVQMAIDLKNTKILFTLLIKAKEKGIKLTDVFGEKLEMLTSNLNPWMIETTMEKLFLLFPDLPYLDDMNGNKLLRQACVSGNFKIVEMCIKKDQGYGKLSSKWTVFLGEAVSQGQVEIVKLLLNYYNQNKNLHDIKTLNWSNALCKAREHKWLGMIAFLTENGIV